MTFGAGSLVAILALSISLGCSARDPQPPVANLDHWQSGYAFYDCSQPGGAGFLPPFSSTDDAVGIHSHGDGIISIHPFEDEAAGANARLHHFFTAMRVDVQPERIGLDSGRVLRSGLECADGSGAAEIRMLRWDNMLAAVDGNQPDDVIRENFDDVALRGPGEAFVIVYAAPDTPIDPAATIQAAIDAYGARTPTEIVVPGAGS